MARFDDLPPRAQAHALRFVDEHVDTDHLVDRLTGRDGGLRTSKPATDDDTGLTQYVWRHARLHAGDDPRVPVTAAWWLADYLDEHDVTGTVSGVLDDEGKAIRAILDQVATLVVIRLGRDPTAGARRWQKGGLLEGT